jgi:hypothetical protein
MLNVEQTIISQYSSAATIVQLVQSIDQCVDPRADIEAFYSTVWDVATAQGFGLDIWGRIVGVDRAVNVPADTPNPGGYPWTPGPYIMDDYEYRSVIMIKAMVNIMSCTAQALNRMLSMLFESRGRCYVADLGDMTFTYVFEFALYPFEYAILTQSGIAPRPAGVLAKIVQLSYNNKLFGFFESHSFQPFDQGVFYNG